MPKRTRSYSAWQLEKLTDPKIAVGFLNASLQESTEVFLAALGDVAQANQMSKVAKESGVQRESLYRSLSKRGNPTLDTLTGVLSALGLKLTISDVKDEDITLSGSAESCSSVQKSGFVRYAEHMTYGMFSAVPHGEFNMKNQQLIGPLRTKVVPKITTRSSMEYTPCGVGGIHGYKN
jgi:probable addiction module antidote protein